MNRGTASPGQHHRRPGERAVGLEPHPDRHDQLVRIGGARRRVPELREPRTQRIDLALRQLRRGAARGAERDGVVDCVAGGRDALRRALVEQRLDISRIELRLLLLLLLRRRLGLGLLGLGFLDLVLLDRVGDQVALGLGLLLLGRCCRPRRGWRRRLLVGRGLHLFRRDLGSRIVGLLALTDLVGERPRRLELGRIARARGQLGEVGRRDDVDRHRLFESAGRGLIAKVITPQASTRRCTATDTAKHTTSRRLVDMVRPVLIAPRLVPQDPCSTSVTSATR